MEKIIITNVLPGGAGFGIRINGGDSVYLPPSLGEMDNDDIDREYLAKLIPNPNVERREVTPWRAQFVDWEGRIMMDPADHVFVEPGSPPTPPEPLVDPERKKPLTILTMTKQELKDSITAAISSCDRPMRTVEITDAIMRFVPRVDPVKESNAVHNALVCMWNEGMIAQADIRSSGKQERTSGFVWALTATDLFKRLTED